MLNFRDRSRASFFRRPPFWIISSLVAVAAVAFALRYFAVAFPVVGVELAMDRESALGAAEEMALNHGWGPEGFRQAASFGEDHREARTYLELAHGVDDAFTLLVEEAGYHPYTWRVRHFREEERTEVTVRFTPAGEPYGFALQLPEDEPGEALGSAAARDLAEDGARIFGVDLAPYELVEASQETRPGGRVDHSFVYERDDAELGDADARLRLRVAGDRLSEVRHLIRVPEAFSREYEEVRSANQTLALVASLVFLLLFGLAGCGGGIFYLLRRGTLIWKPALAWGLVVAGLVALSVLNGLPLAWMGYDTAVPRPIFLTQQLVTAAGTLLVGGGILAVIFMAAEGLGRRALPDEPLQWRLWSRGVANTRAVLGRTVGGYLLAAVQVGFVVAFYLMATRREGWWMPSETLVQPDLVATWFPWIAAAAPSLMAGFWEESLFRAVPIALAILLGARWGWKGVLVAGAVVFQALVFAAAHADYPQQPPYARVVELVTPAVAWGLVYLRFGLLPVILAHALYNLTWFSLPIFTAPAGLWGDRVLLVAVALIPLGVVLHRIARDGLADEVPDGGLNRAVATLPGREEPPSDVREEERATVPLEPREAGVPGEEAPREPAHPAGVTAVGAAPLRKSLLAAGALGAVLWVLLTPFDAHVPPLETTRSAAVETARGQLVADGQELDEPWRPLARVQATPGAPHRFVWEEGGPEAYRVLLEEGHLAGPSWLVRFVRFTGPVEERAEEYRVRVGPGGEVTRREHVLPESRPGAELEEEEARAVAEGAVRDRFGFDPGALVEVSAEARSHPERVDWAFTFSRPDSHPMERGDARFRVGLAGDRVSDGYLFVHVPEEWEREERSRNNRAIFLALLSGFALAAIIGGSAVLGIVRWAKGRGGFHTGALWTLGGLLLATGLLDVWNRWPATEAGFGTAQPYRDQLFTMVSLEAVAVLVVAGIGGLAAGFLHGWLPRRVGPPGGPSDALGAVGPFGWGLLAGFAVAGAVALFGTLLPDRTPVWFGYAPAAARFPSLAPALEGVSTLVFQAVLLGLVVVALDRLTTGWGRKRVVGSLVVLLAATAFTGGLSDYGLAPWVAATGAVAIGLVLLVPVVRTLTPAILPGLVVVPTTLPGVRDGLAGAHPGAGAGAVLGLLVLLAIAAAWTRFLPVAETARGPARRERPDLEERAPGPPAVTGRSAAGPDP